MLVIDLRVSRVWVAVQSGLAILTGWRLKKQIRLKGYEKHFFYYITTMKNAFNVTKLMKEVVSCKQTQNLTQFYRIKQKKVALSFKKKFLVRFVRLLGRRSVELLLLDSRLICKTGFSSTRVHNAFRWFKAST